ncbi:hypothetical protein MMC07_007320, partial [Pseudocyphellaria aurata]|nr:hypothetical protein [Pseudocyphellaria aurata]
SPSHPRKRTIDAWAIDARAIDARAIDAWAIGAQVLATEHVNFDVERPRDPKRRKITELFERFSNSSQPRVVLVPQQPTAEQKKAAKEKMEAQKAAKQAKKEKEAGKKKAFAELSKAKFALAVPKAKDVVFEPLAFRFPARSPQDESDPCWNDAYNLFCLFWPESIWNTLADNTNSYAQVQSAIEELSAKKTNQRKWYRTNADELKVFVGICIYLGLYSAPMAKLWSTNKSRPLHPIPHHMKQTHFFQLRRFFHISGPKQDQPSQNRMARTSVCREVQEEEEEEEEEKEKGEDWPEDNSEFDEAPDMPELNADSDDEDDSNEVATILSPDEHR